MQFLQYLMVVNIHSNLVVVPGSNSILANTYYLTVLRFLHVKHARR